MIIYYIMFILQYKLLFSLCLYLCLYCCVSVLLPFFGEKKIYILTWLQNLTKKPILQLVKLSFFLTDKKLHYFLERIYFS